MCQICESKRFKLNEQQTKQALDWLSELADSGCFRDYDSGEELKEDIGTCRSSIERAIERHYDGGLATFWSMSYEN